MDFSQIRLLISLFFRLDLRRGRQGKRLSPLLVQCILYGVLGLSLSVMVVDRASPFMYLVTTQAYLLFMAASAFLLELSQTLIDPEERETLAPRPIHPQTYFAAKILYLALYIGATTILLAFPPSLVGLTLPGTGPVFPVGFLAVAILSGFWASLLMAALYLKLMRSLHPERLKDTIAYFQIGLSFALILFFQWFPRQEAALDAQGPEGWLRFFPPSWFAVLLHSLMGWPTEGLKPALLGLGLPAGVALLVLRSVSVDYLRLTEEPATESSRARRKAKPSRTPVRLFRDPERDAGFFLASRMLKRDRFTRLSTYPLLGIPLAFLFLAMMEGLSDPFVQGVPLEVRQSGLLFVYLFFFVNQSLIQALTYAKDPEAAWIYAASPIRSFGRFFQGVRMAVMARLLLPFWCLLAVLFLWKLPASHALKHLLFLSLGGAFVGSLSAFGVRTPPFSRERIPGGRLSRLLGLVFTLPLFGMWLVLQRRAYGDPFAYWGITLGITGLIALMEGFLHPKWCRIRTDA